MLATTKLLKTSILSKDKQSQKPVGSNKSLICRLRFRAVTILRGLMTVVNCKFK